MVTDPKDYYVANNLNQKLFTYDFMRERRTLCLTIKPIEEQGVCVVNSHQDKIRQY